MQSMKELSVRYLNMARERDTARFNFTKTKGTRFVASCSALFRALFLTRYLDVFSVTEQLAIVGPEREAALTRVKELEEQVANLTAESVAAKKESVAATRRADEAVQKEKEALKQATELKEALTPRLESVVNSLSGNCSFPVLCFLLLLLPFLIF